MSPLRPAVCIWIFAVLPILVFVAPAFYSTSYSTVALTAGQITLASIWGAVVVGAIVLAFFDWRSLKGAGVARPFHWTWSFLVVINLGFVYALGRTIVANRTGSGRWAPVVVSGVLLLNSLVAGVALVVVFALGALVLFAAGHSGA